MAKKTIRIRRGASTAWGTSNPILGLGELGKETDTGRLKTGDGATAWNNLKYDRFDFQVSSISELNAIGFNHTSIAYLVEGGRKGRFTYYPSTADYVVDDGIVFEASDGGFWVRDIGEVIRPEWYINEANHAIGINKALAVASVNSLTSGISTVQLTGSYFCSTTINVPINSNLLIQGKATIVRNQGMTGNMVRVYGNADNALASITFRDIEFDGNCTADDFTYTLRIQNGVYKELNITNTVYGVWADNLAGLTFDNCKFYNIHGTGLYTYRVKSVVVGNNCLFRNIHGRAAIDQNSLNAELSVTSSVFIDIGMLPDEFLVDGVAGVINDTERYSHQFGDGVLDAGLRTYVAGNKFVNCNRIAITRDIATDQGILNASAVITGNYILHDSPNLVNSNPPASIWVEHSRRAIIQGNIIEFKQRGRETYGSVTGIRFNESNQDYVEAQIAHNQIIANDFIDYNGDPAAVYVAIFSVNIRSYSKVSMDTNHVTGRVLDGFYLGNSPISNVKTIFKLSNNNVNLFPVTHFECSALKIVAYSTSMADDFPEIECNDNHFRVSTDDDLVWATLSYKRCISIGDNLPAPVKVAINGGAINYGSIYLGNNIEKFTLRDITDIRTILTAPFSVYEQLKSISIKNCEIKEIFLSYIERTDIVNNRLTKVTIDGGEDIDISENIFNVDEFTAYSLTFDTLNGDISNLTCIGNRFKYIGDNARNGIELKRTDVTKGYKTCTFASKFIGNGQAGSRGMKTFGTIADNPTAYLYFDKTGNTYSNLALNEEGFTV